MAEDEFLRLKRLANRAVEIKDDADFLEIVANIKNRIIRDWAGTRSEAADRREELYRDLMAVGRIESYLKELPQQYRVEVNKQQREERRGR